MGNINDQLFNHIDKEYSIAVSEFKNLRGPIIEDDHPVIYGRIDVIDNAGNNWDTYEVKILFPENYPNVLPKLFEIGGKIKREPDWHINADGSCCLGPDVKLIRALGGKITLLNWLKIHVVSFLANHYYKIKNEVYAGKEYSHGTRGIIEYYQELWNINNIYDLRRRLEYITGVRKWGKNKKCFCGSGKQYKLCHMNAKVYQGVHTENYIFDLIYITHFMKHSQI
jgi:hypothetical protein